MIAKIIKIINIENEGGSKNTSSFFSRQFYIATFIINSVIILNLKSKR